MGKKGVLLWALVWVCLNMNAAVSYMVIEQKSGRKYSFLLQDNPVITYEDGYLVVDSGMSTYYAIRDIKNYHFSASDETSVEEISSNNIRITNLDDATLSIENGEPGGNVTLSNVNGILYSTATIDGNKSAQISLPSAQGVYILSIGKQSFKIIRK